MTVSADLKYFIGSCRQSRRCRPTSRPGFLGGGGCSDYIRLHLARINLFTLLRHSEDSRHHPYSRVGAVCYRTGVEGATYQLLHQSLCSLCLVKMAITWHCFCNQFNYLMDTSCWTDCSHSTI